MMVDGTSHSPSTLGGARGHAHTALPLKCSTDKVAHPEGLPGWAGSRRPSVCICRGHLPGSNVRGSGDGLGHELTHGPSWASVPRGACSFQDAAKPLMTTPWGRMQTLLAKYTQGLKKWVHFLAVAPLLIKMENSLYLNFFKKSSVLTTDTLQVSPHLNSA